MSPLLNRPPAEACRNTYLEKPGDLTEEIGDSLLVTHAELLPSGMTFCWCNHKTPPPLPFYSLPIPLVTIGINLGEAFDGQVRLAGERHVSHAEPGSMLLIPAGCDSYSEYRPSNRPIQTLGLASSANILEEIAFGVGLPVPHNGLPTTVTGQADPQAVLLGQAILKELERGTPLLLETLANALSIHLLRTVVGVKSTPAKPANGLPPRIARRISDFMQQYLHEPISLEDLAQLAGLSVYHFCRMFKRSFGMPPHRYLARMRVAKGRELLTGTNLSIGEISDSLGYASSSHFSHAFKQLTRCSPQEYRRQNRVHGR
jgi:AraC-like DNA-binding protein